MLGCRVSVSCFDAMAIERPWNVVVKVQLGKEEGYCIKVEGLAPAQRLNRGLAWP